MLAELDAWEEAYVHGAFIIHEYTDNMRSYRGVLG